MSQETAEDLKEETTEEEEVSTLEEDKDPEGEEAKGDDQEVEEGESKETGDETTEDEVVLEVKGSQPSQKTKSFTKRVQKFKGQIQQEKERADSSDERVRILEEQNKIKDLALEQAKKDALAPKRPKADDFDGGLDDPGFIKQQDEFYDHRADKRMDAKLGEFRQQQTQTYTQDSADKDLDRILIEYQEKASKGPKDHEEKEDIAINILGNEDVNQIISKWDDDAPLLLYYLGSHKDEAERVRDLLKQDPVRGVRKLERLLTEISFTPKNKNPAPEPDEEIPGGVSSGGKRGPKGAKFE